MRWWQSPSGCQPRSTCFRTGFSRAGSELGSGFDAGAGLDVDQDVGAVEAVTDLVGQGVGRPVCGLERRPVGELEGDVDPPYRIRETAAGRHVAVTVEPQVQNAWEVLAVYQRLGQIRGVEFVF